MTFAFRVDSSTRIGTGHLIRCLTLAETLRSRGANATFLCRPLDGAATSRVEASGFDVRYLGNNQTGEYSSEREDAIETLKLIAEYSLTRVVVDHYDLSLEWETIVSRQVENLTVIEDLTNRQHRCDLLINQNLLSTQAQDYSASLTGVVQTLVGPRYALLQPDYAEIRTLRYNKISDVKRIVVFMGGSDPENSTDFVLRSLTSMNLNTIEVDVVIGPINPHRSTILQKFQSHRSIKFHVDLPNIATLLASTDMAIGAGGIANWERMCLGVPSVVIDIAENQREICVELAYAGLIEYAGSAHSISATSFENSVAKLILDRVLRSQYSLRSQTTVDGLGARRVAETLLPGKPESLTLRTCRAEDVMYYFNWVNDPSVRVSSLNTDPVAWIDHEAWFVARLSDPSCRMFVLCTEGLPVGQIRFQKVNDSWSINYSLDEYVRSRGWGRYLVERGIAEMKISTTGKFIANVKATNIASQKIFEQLGFVRSDLSGTAVEQFELKF